MLKYIIIGVVCSVLFLVFGFIIGSNVTYEEPVCPDCVQKIESCPVCEQKVCEPTECKEITTNSEVIDNTNSTYIIGLIREIKRCEEEVRHYMDSNKTVVCSQISENLEQCQQKLNMTKEILED